MSSLSRWSHYTAREWMLIAAAFMVLCVVRVALALLPWRVIAPRLSEDHPGSRARLALEPEELSISVARAARLVPRSYCLAQAVTLRWLSLAAGIPMKVVIGAGRLNENRLQAHAWVEHEGRVVHGASESLTNLRRFTRFQGE